MRGADVITVIIVPTIEEQRAEGALTIYDPTAINVREPIPLIVDYNYDKVIGRVVNIRVENGRLVGDADVEIGWGGIPVETHVEEGTTVIDRLDLYEVTLSPPREKR